MSEPCDYCQAENHGAEFDERASLRHRRDHLEGPQRVGRTNAVS